MVTVIKCNNELKGIKSKNDLEESRQAHKQRMNITVSTVIPRSTLEDNVDHILAQIRLLDDFQKSVILGYLKQSLAQ